jgi:protein PsiE
MTEDAKNTSTLIARINDQFESLLLIIQAVALIIITVTTAIAIVDEGINMYVSRKVGLANLLLLFLFIEILSMVRQYSLGQHELKLKTPLVITIVAVARYLIINMEHLTSKYILITSIAILILTFALYVARHIKDLYSDEKEDKFKHKILKDAAEKLLHAGHCGNDNAAAKPKTGL